MSLHQKMEMKMQLLKKKLKQEKMSCQNLQKNCKIGPINKKLSIFKNMKQLILKHINAEIKII